MNKAEVIKVMQEHIESFPSDREIKKLIKALEDGSDLEIAVYLAAFGLMRRSEISALLDTDINETVVTVNKAMVKDKDNVWIIKDPKTFSSNRDIDYPEFVIDKMKGRKGNIVKLNPEQISMRFNRLLKKII